MRASSTLVAAVLLLTAASVAADIAYASNVPALRGGELLAATGFRLEQVRDRDGEPIVRELEVRDRSRQAALAGLVRVDDEVAGWLADDPIRAVALLTSSQQFGRLDEPRSGDPLAALDLPPDELALLEACAPGACRFKLDAEGIARVRAIDWRASDAREQFLAGFRAALLAKAERYRASGAAGLITYADKPEPFAVADGLARVERELAAVFAQVPELGAWLARDPDGPPDGADDALVWSVSDFGFRPLLSLDHVVRAGGSDTGAVASATLLRTIYANHYLAGRVQLAALIDGERAFGLPGRFLLVVDQILFDDEVGALRRRLIGRGLRTTLAERLDALVAPPGDRG